MSVSLVGVLALQGDFAAHEAALWRFGVATRQVRSPADLAGLSGLVLPGGESTTMLRLLEAEGLWQPLGQVLHTGLPVLATCAGLILLAQRIEGRQQRSYGILPVTVVRNGYGRQVHSGSVPLQSSWLPPQTRGVFIRAPRITAVGPGCEVLAWRDGDPVLLRQGNVLAACFHPELTPDHPVTARFCAMVADAQPLPSTVAALP